MYMSRTVSFFPPLFTSTYTTTKCKWGFERNQLQNECKYKKVVPTPPFFQKRPLAGILYCSPSPPLYVAKIWRRIELYLGLTMGFFFGGFSMEPRLPLRQDSGYGLLPPPECFWVPAGRALGDGEVKTKLGIKIIDAMASTKRNASEVNGVLLEVGLWSVFHSPNSLILIILPGALPFPKLTGPVLSQPASASPQTASAGAASRSPPSRRSSLSWGGLPRTAWGYALRAAGAPAPPLLLAERPWSFVRFGRARVGRQVGAGVLATRCWIGCVARSLHEIFVWLPRWRRCLAYLECGMNMLARRASRLFSGPYWCAGV